MNIEKAKSVSLETVLEIIGSKPVKGKNGQVWYLSPLRDEKTASFNIRLHDNVWYDFGEGTGGDTLAFVCAYLKMSREDHTVADGLRWLQNMTAGFVGSVPVKPSVPKMKKPSGWQLIRTESIEDLALIRYLEKRCIPLSVAQKYLVEAYVRNRETNKGMYALGFKNEDGGYELRNPFFQSCVSPKTITFIRCEKSLPKGINVFEGVFDFLSAAICFPDIVLNNDNICFNSLSCLNSALPYMHNYGYQTLYSWLDNDPPGHKATMLLSEFTKSQEALKHKPMNNIYRLHKDVNAWHVAKLLP